MKLNKYIDHTLLKPDAQQEQIEKLIEEAKAYDFASVCVNPTWVNFAAEGLRDSDVKVCTVLVFLWEQIPLLSKRVKQKMLFKMVPMKLTWSLISVL